MHLWARPFTPDELDAHQRDSGGGAIGIHFTAVGDDWVEAELPLDARTADATGAVSGGALSILAESVASMAATMAVDTRVRHCLGQSLTVHHATPATHGPVRARATQLAANPRMQVWQVRMYDAGERLVSVAEMTMAVVEGQPRRPPTVALGG